MTEKTHWLYIHPSAQHLATEVSGMLKAMRSGWGVLEKEPIGANAEIRIVHDEKPRLVLREMECPHGRINRLITKFRDWFDGEIALATDKPGGVPISQN